MDPAEAPQRASFAVPVDVIEDEMQRPVPTVWRAPLASMVACLVAGDYALRGASVPVELDEAFAEYAAESVAAYGETLVPLPPETWSTSVVMLRSAGVWGVLVDLWGAASGRLDLVLEVFVHRNGSGFRYEPHMVYVP